MIKEIDQVMGQRAELKQFGSRVCVLKHYIVNCNIGFR